MEGKRRCTVLNVVLFWPESAHARSAGVSRSLLSPRLWFSKHLINIYGRLHNINWQNDPRIELPPVCLFNTNQVSGEVFLPHSAGLLAPRFTGALLPESAQGQWCHLTRPPRARSAAGEATSRVLCFSGGDFSSAAVHLSVPAAHRRSLFTQVSVRDAKREKINAHERAKNIPKDGKPLVLSPAAAWAVSGWCFSSSSTCPSWGSTSPDSFTSPMRIIRKCKWALHSFLGSTGGFLTVGCISGLTCGRSASCLHGWLHWPSCSWQWALVWLVQRTRDWTSRRATLTRGW